MENHAGDAAGTADPGVQSPSAEAEKIPKDLEQVLPSDPFELLRISRALALQACAIRIKGLQDENSKIQSSSDATEKELRGKVSELQDSLKEANEKLGKSEEDMEKLNEEKAALVAMVKKLNRDVAKLETFKRTLMAQLQDEDEAPGSGAVPRSITVDSAGSAAGFEDGGASGAGTALRMAQAAKNASGAFGTPSVASQAAALAESSSAEGDSSGKPLKQIKTFRTPIATPSIFSPAYTPSATPPHSSTSASPRTSSKGRPRVDGKEFFRQARSRLSYEQFSTFLANIKELNAHKQTREETLKKAEEIFGAENKDLYTQFESLLSRHLPS